MKRIALFLLAAMMFAGIAAATPVCINGDTLASYMLLGNTGCTIGDKLFTNFGYLPSVSGPRAVAPTSSEIAILTLPGDGISDPGLAFSSGGWAAYANNTYQIGSQDVGSTITFTVAALSGATLIKDATLSTTAGIPLGTTGTAKVTETLNVGQTQIPGSPLTTVFGVNGADHIEFVDEGGVAVSALNVSTVIQVHAEANRDGAHLVTLSVVEEHFSELVSVPEPYQALLLGSGLLFFGLRSKWRSRRS